jgi:hypothetical protein
MPAQAPQPSPLAAAAFGAALTAAAGTLTPEGAAAAQAILAGVPASIRAAARSPHDAPVLIFGLILDDDETVRQKQMALVAASAGSESLHALQQLDPALRQLKEEHRLPVLQLALPSVKELGAPALSSFAGTLDDLVQAGGKVTPFEFALRRLVLRTLATNGSPSAAATQIYSFQAVTGEISVVLSSLAHASSDNADEAARAFAEGASQLKLVEGRLAFLPDAQSGLVQLNDALDKLAGASGPIKQRLLVAGAHVVGADGVVLPTEAELLRAVAAALDVPVPPLSAISAA